MGHFFLKIGVCMSLLSNSMAAHPYQNQTLNVGIKWLKPQLETDQPPSSPGQHVVKI